jgi:hypothetical protein
MNLRRFVPISVAALSLILLQQLPARQAEQPGTPATKAEKKAKKRAKKAAEENPSEAGKTAASTRKAKTETSGSAQRTAPTVPESEIAAAKASGKVWVNTETGVYHKGGRWYGATKQGKFMTEQEAIKAGYRASKEK